MGARRESQSEGASGGFHFGGSRYSGVALPIRAAAFGRLMQIEGAALLRGQEAVEIGGKAVIPAITLHREAERAERGSKPSTKNIEPQEHEPSGHRGDSGVAGIGCSVIKLLQPSGMRVGFKSHGAFPGCNKRDHHAGGPDWLRHNSGAGRRRPANPRN